ncbi:MAG: hypothetical protein COA44_12980 [Arcobacter sp.]|nr:MAG: hypothetical protein COA44_12980 [Arcobacter sp.]
MNFQTELEITNKSATTSPKAIDTNIEVKQSQSAINAINYTKEKNEHLTTLSTYANSLHGKDKDELLEQIEKNTFIFEREDAKKFVANNWLEIEHNEVLNALDDLGVSIWLNTDGDYSCRMSKDGEINKMPASKLKKVLASKLKKVITISEDADANIKAYDLLLSSGDTFNPQCKQEFFEEKGEIHRNTFRPTSYMELDISKMASETKAINRLIDHLVKGNKNYEKWLINWLAYFFQGLVKSPVALFLKGQQGAGKGVLYDDIIVPLFGKNQCIQVNDKTMKGDFLGGIVEGRLVMNLDEISSGIQNNKEFKNQLKALISNRAGTFQKKFQNTEKETPLFAMILITSNEPKALEVEHKDRRLTIFETGGNIAHEDFLEYGSYKALIKAVTAELEDFALMLLQYPVDVKMATTAMNTPEKEALVGVSSNRFKSFSNAVKGRNIEFFTDLQDDLAYAPYYAELEECYRKNRLSRKLLKRVFGKLYGEITTNALMEQLRAIDPIFFNEELNSAKTSGGDFLFKLDSECNDSYLSSNTTLPIAVNNTIEVPTFENIVKPIHPSLVSL